MRTVTITVGTGAQGVTIGRRAENEATAVIFDVSALIETYGDGGAVLMVKRPTDADAYPATVERSGTSVIWTPTETDLAYKGMGEAELFWYVDGMLAKTAVYTINIRRDIGETTGDAPAPYDDWIATLTELGGQTAENAQRAEVARAAAETAATTATSAANTASTAAERAETAANNAEQDAASTAADRTAAEDAATRAESSATAAAQSASAAATSAGQASVSANSAATSATSSAQSADRAEQAATNASTSATVAQQAADDAESAATTAQNAATTATTKAAEANTSAGVAAQNATTATVKAQEAAQSATQAAASATAAQTAQTAAEAAQTGAQTAKAAAESAAESAEAEADRAETYADRMIDVYPTDTASGSIASFPDGADNVEVKSAVVQIVPKQAGTGDPSPDNVRPITGWDAVTVTGCGENLLPPYSAAQLTHNGITFTNDNGRYTITGTSTARASCDISMYLKAGTYTFAGFNSFGGAAMSAYILGASGTLLSNIAMMADNYTRTFTITEPATVLRFTIAGGLTINGTASLEIVPGTTAPTTWAPYSGTTYPLTLPATVYGGQAVYEGGGMWTVTSSMALVDLGTLSYIKYTPSGSAISNFYASIADKKNNTPMYCSALAFSGNFSSAGTALSGSADNSVAGFANTSSSDHWIYVRMDAYSTAAALKAALNGVILCYETQTTQAYSVTTDELLTLLGQNNIWADCGDTSVTYRADIGLFIDKKLAALAAALS